ncbi:YpiB family protein [Eremococcus coleocola]|uniref:YpiB family protein n=1 Tax=Eremococcus coleocola TaxID=88132 RepID=UPI0004282CEC|nr:YpiB family protein [Eremococcus coleocola]
MSQNENKRAFIEWLMQHYRHANPSVNYLLKYIASQPNLLNRIEFSENCKYAPRGLYISYYRNSDQPFVYYKDQLSYTLSEQAFHDLRMSGRFDEPVYYIELNIPNLYQELMKFDVFEENPFTPQENNQADLDEYLFEMSFQAKMTELQAGINRALEVNNFEEVDYLLKQIEDLSKGRENQGWSHED